MPLNACLRVLYSWFSFPCYLFGSLQNEVVSSGLWKSKGEFMNWATINSNKTDFFQKKTEYGNIGLAYTMSERSFDCVVGLHPWTTRSCTRNAELEQRLQIKKWGTRVCARCMRVCACFFCDFFLAPFLLFCDHVCLTCAATSRCINGQIACKLKGSGRLGR